MAAKENFCLRPPPSPGPSSQNQNSTSLDYFKISKHWKSNDKRIALAQVNKKNQTCA